MRTNEMNDLIVKIFAGVAVSALVLILGPLVGGVLGWVFAAVFDDSFRTLCAILRVEATGFEVGAALGFAGAFLRTTVSKV